MRLLFVCRMFAGGVGGVERMAILLMNAMVGRGHDVSLFTWDEAGARSFYPMDEAIRWSRLDMGDPMTPAGWRLRLGRSRRLRRLAASARPDVAVAFQHGPFLFAAVSMLGRDVPIVLSERNAPDQLEHIRAGRHRGTMFQTMRLASAITVQFPGYVERYPPYLRARLVVLPNPVLKPSAYAHPGDGKEGRVLLSVGRLSYQKNFTVLLHAFARVCGGHPRWSLRVVGDGDERAALDALAGELGIRDRVSFKGHTKDVAAEYPAADLFCLPSRWEGFPNALAEALAHGLPAVGFERCAGVNELIVPGHNGLLAQGNDDPATLASALGALMADAEGRARLGMEARRIVEAYDPERVIDSWERMLHRLVRNP